MLPDESPPSDMILRLRAIMASEWLNRIGSQAAHFVLGSIRPGYLLLTAITTGDDVFSVDWTGRQIAVRDFDDDGAPYLFDRMESALLLLGGMLMNYVSRADETGYAEQDGRTVAAA